jgi:hypothetical protein
MRSRFLRWSSVISALYADDGMSRSYSRTSFENSLGKNSRSADAAFNVCPSTAGSCT